MKRLGLIGGMSWESTAVYYRLLNQMTREKYGGMHSADLILRSLEFNRIAHLQADGKWDELTSLMVDTAKELENAGAEALLICTNTMHLMAPEVQSAVSIPLLHIADATATAIKNSSVEKPLLLATRFTMEKDFYRGKLRSDHGIETLIPNEEDRAEVHWIIYEELVQGIVRSESKQVYLDIIEKYQREQGIDGVILGCTEIDLLISQDDLDIPAFDTTALHAQMGVDFS